MKNFFNAQCMDLSHEGLGVVRKDEKPYFVFDLLPGEKGKIEVIKENKNYGYGKVVQRNNSSQYRINPLCVSFGKCGGCDLCHMDYDYEADFKLKMVNETYKRIGHLDYTFKKIIKADNTSHYRNKVQIPFALKNGKNICGFYKKQSHEIIEIRSCLLQTEITTDIAIFVKNIMNEYKINAYDECNHKGMLRHLLIRKNTFNDYMVVLIVNEYKKEDVLLLASKIKDKFPQVKSIILNINTEKNNIILGDEHEVIYGNDYLLEDILGLKFKMSHKAFFQINHDQTEKLYANALTLANINKNDTVLDLYCGVGTITLLASQKAKKAIGIEIVKEAIIDAKENAKINNIENVEFIVGKAEEKVNQIKDEIDVLIVDPPRKGLDKDLIETIKKFNINKMIYVSCDVATMARDVSLLTSDYKITDGFCVDLFPRTSNVETVICLEKK